MHKQLFPAIMALLGCLPVQADEFSGLEAAVEFPAPPEQLDDSAPLGDIAKDNSLFTSAYIDFRVRSMLKGLSDRSGRGGVVSLDGRDPENLNICSVSAPPGTQTVINVCPIGGVVFERGK